MQCLLAMAKLNDILFEIGGRGGSECSFVTGRILDTDISSWHMQNEGKKTTTEQQERNSKQK